MTRVAVTGLALESPYGDGLDALWAGVCRGPIPVKPVHLPKFPELQCPFVPLPHQRFDAFPPGQRSTELAISLAERALVAAGAGTDRGKIGIALGSVLGDIDYLDRPLPAAPPPPFLRTVVERLRLGGPCVNTPVGCGAGNLAMMWAVDRLRSGEAELMLAGGAEMVGVGTLGSFELIGNLTSTLARPFDRRRDGALLGDGGALLVLERWDHAVGRGASILAELAGVGAAHDASHLFRPEPEGRGLQAAIRAALEDAGLEPRDIGYVNAHAPGTVANDAAEARAYVSVFGPRGVPVGSTKGALGHAQGGANGLEAAVCLAALLHQAIPPTLESDPDPAFELDVVLGVPRAAPLDAVLSAAAGLGGANCVLIFRRAR